MSFDTKKENPDPKKVIEEFLQKKNLAHTFDDKLNQYRTMITLYDTQLRKDFQYPVAITLLKDWVVTEAAVIDLKSIPSDIRVEKIYDGLLRANFMIPEVNYALYKSMVVSLAWSKLDSLNVENFTSEFTGVLTGVDKLPEIVMYAKIESFSPPKEFAPMYQ
jgi:hypothetical protein